MSYRIVHIIRVTAELSTERHNLRYDNNFIFIQQQMQANKQEKKRKTD